MENFKPKLVIVNHIDELINKIDIDIETCLEKYKEDQILGDLEFFRAENRTLKINSNFKIDFFDSFSPSLNQQDNQWSESTKVVDYLNQVRSTTIEELRKAQEYSLKYYSENASQFIINTEELPEYEIRYKIDVMKRQVFGDKFCFHVTLVNQPSWVFNTFTFVVDFNMSEYDVLFVE